MIEINDLLGRLDRVRKHGNYWTSRCPAHKDTNPSFSIRLMDDGIAVKCHTGCDTATICRSLGIEASDLFYDHDDSPKILDTYDYIGPDGELLYQVVRWVPKKFTQRRPGPNDTWINNLKDTMRVPYRLPELVEAVGQGRRVFLVEGERDVERLEREGLVATTTPAGAGNWRSEYAQWFQDAAIAILPDNDPQGEQYATNAATDLAPVAKDVRIVHLTGLPDKGDVTDWLTKHTRAELEQAVSAATPYTGGQTPRIDSTTDSITYTWSQLVIALDRLQNLNGYVWAEVGVTWHGNPLVRYQRINLQSASSKRDLVTELNRTDKDEPWHSYLAEAFGTAIERYRTVDRLIDIRTVTTTGPPDWLLGDLWPDLTRPSLLFGDSESSKSVLATCACVSLASGRTVIAGAQSYRVGPVGYLDWEDDPNLFAYRVQLICGTLDIDPATVPIWYHHPTGSLNQTADAIAREFQRKGIIAAVIDSRGPAQQGSLSDEEATNSFFNDINRLDTRTLVIDHLDKHSVKDGGPQQHSFGSIYTRGRVASSLYVRSVAAVGAQRTVTVSDAKWSHGPKRKERSYVIDWSQGLRIDRLGHVYLDEASERTREHADQIYDWLTKNGPAGPSAISRGTGINKGTADRLLKKHVDIFKQDHQQWMAIRPEDWAELPIPY